MNIFYLWSLPYMKAHLLFTVLPSIILWMFSGNYFLRYKKTFVIVTLISITWGFIFDLVASPLLKLWHFNSGPNLNIWFLGLPLEEWMFLFIVPQELTAVLLLFRKKLYA